MNIIKLSKTSLFIFAIILNLTLGTVFLNSLIINNNQSSSERNASAMGKIQPSAEGHIDSEDQEIFWFIHVTDTQHIWYNDDKVDAFHQFLNESYITIKPEFIFNTGDLVDSDFDDFIIANERDQRKEEWETYWDALQENGMNSSNYMDVMGNHDAYGDPSFPYFMKYSVMGKELDALQYGFKRSFSFGDYAFIGLHTPEDNGVRYPFALFGYLNKEELDWYEEELKEYEDCEKIFIFGHHPPFEINSEFNSNGKNFFALNEEYGVDFYFMGHGHINSFEKINEMMAIETTKFDDVNGAYRIVALDQNQLSTSLEKVDEWPQGIITNPPRQEYLTEDLDEVDKIRVLAWDPKGVESVKYRALTPNGEVELTDWLKMDNATNTGPLWEGDWDDVETQMAKYSSDLTSCLIEVEIEGKSGKTTKQIIYSSSKPFHFGWQIGYPLIAISFIAFVSLVTIYNYYRRTHLPEHKKKPEEIVDPKLKRLYLLKLVVFLAVPLTFGGMYVDQITAVFSLFFLNLSGMYYNSLLLIYTAVLFLFSVVIQVFLLSFKHRKGLLGATIISLGWMGFMLVFFLLHYPLLSWISPGYYLMIALDIFILKRNREMRLGERVLGSMENSA